MKSESIFMLCLAAILYGCGRTGVSYEKKSVTATVAGKVMKVQDYVGSTLKFIAGDTLVCSISLTKGGGRTSFSVL